MNAIQRFPGPSRWVSCTSMRSPNETCKKYTSLFRLADSVVAERVNGDAKVLNGRLSVKAGLREGDPHRRLLLRVLVNQR